MRAGILDQQAALRWIAANIAAFGGDPSRVTLLGQSSGGTSILALLASPGTAGLIAGAISLSASPNMTMSLDQAYAYNAPVRGAVGCGGTGGGLACLLAAAPAALVAAVPASWNPPTFFPTAPGGNPDAGLAIIDGVTLPAPLPAALAAGLVDVPLILQSMRDESDISPNPAVLNRTLPAYAAWLDAHFAPWGAGVGRTLYGLYADDTPRDAGQMYYDLDADLGVTCGTTALAVVAAGGFKSPVYLSLVTQPPAAPVDGRALPFHTWDIVAAAGLWDRGGYTPGASDLALGALLRAEWFALATNGSVPGALGMPRVNDAAGFPANYVSVEQWAEGARAVTNNRAAMCAAFDALGFGDGYWWVN